MNKKIRWITQTAVMLALVVTLQYITKPVGQLLTGTCVNTMLAVSVLLGGLGCGLTIALLSPILAFLLGIAPQILTVPAIMVGNSVFVILLHVMADRTGRSKIRQIAAWITAALGKFAVLYTIVVWLICGVLSTSLLKSGVMKAPMLKTLPATFSWPQLVTALMGGAIGLCITPVLRKAMKKNTV